MDVRLILMSASCIVIVVLQFIMFDAEAERLMMSHDFYKKTCPQVEDIVREGVRSASLFDPSTPPALLRLLFHDCQVQGCDASILVDKPSEMASKKNLGVRKRDVLNIIKTTLEQVCPRQVSCADILVLAARDAVLVSGGPGIIVPLGRRDSSTPPNIKLVDSSLPPDDIGVDAALSLFSKQGMTIEETVAILGAHTLGITHCFSLKNRLYKSGNNAVMHDGFVNSLKLRCPAYLDSTSAQASFVPNDLTPILFDNDYFVSTVRGQGVLTIDAAMPLDSRTRPYVHKFAALIAIPFSRHLHQLSLSFLLLMFSLETKAQLEGPVIN